MADNEEVDPIEPILERILSARYGEEVRGSIVDALRLSYSGSTQIWVNNKTLYIQTAAADDD